MAMIGTVLDSFSGLARADAAGSLDSVHAWHLHVHEHQIEAVAREHVVGPLSVLHACYPGSGLAQDSRCGQVR